MRALSAGLQLPKARRLCCPWTDSDEGALAWTNRNPGSCEASLGLKADALSSKVQGRQRSKSTAGWGAPISKHGQRRGAANLGDRVSHCGGAGLGGEQGQQPQHETKTGPAPHSSPDYTPHPQPQSGNGAVLTHCSQNHGEFTEICQVQSEPISESTSAKRSFSLHFKDD